jgi:hypothetical protein
MQVLILNGLAELEVTRAWQSFAWLPWDVGEDAGPDEQGCGQGYQDCPGVDG